jgi:tetratricopeptide (TPR) repeat protein
VPLSQSVIWRLQREFYTRRGLKAWTEDLVPNFITNNPFIAEIYARIVFGFLSDCDAEFTREQPLRILELGAGTGKFSYLFLRQLTTLFRSKRFSWDAVHYYMADCSPELIESWRKNPYLAEFVESGMLEFELIKIGEGISSPFLNQKAPLILFANYVFDSLPQDAFIIKDSHISEALVTTTAPADSKGHAAELSQLRLSYRNVDVPLHRYSDESFNQILELYRNRLSAATVLFPFQALRALQELSKFTDGRMLVLAADKGFAHEEALPFSQGPPQIEFHGANCFSQMVNFDAIGKYFASVGGEALLPEKHFASLNICAFLSGGKADRFPSTIAAYREAQAAFGPDDLFTLLAWLNAHMEEMTAPQVLAALRLTRWDPIALNRLFPVLARQLRSVVAERYDLRDAVMKTWANHYPVSAGENVIAFNCGVVLLELRFFEEAIPMFQASQRILGPSAATSYNLGLCALGLGRTAEALVYMTEACKLDPNFEPARSSRQKLEAQNPHQGSSQC